MYFRTFIGLLLLALAPLAFTGQTFNVIKWEYTYNELDEKSGELVIKAKIDPDWHIYSQTQTGDGPLPTVFTFVKTPHYDLDGAVAETDPERKYDVAFGTDVAMFEREVVFVQKIKRNTKKEFEVMGEVECMACNNTMCLPPRTYKFTIKIPQNELK
jgi:hypothetical protein